MQPKVKAALAVAASVAAMGAYVAVVRWGEAARAATPDRDAVPGRGNGWSCFATTRGAYCARDPANCAQQLEAARDGAANACAPQREAHCYTWQPAGAPVASWACLPTAALCDQAKARLELASIQARGCGPVD